MKKEKFDFSKFILDCFICLGLMIVSVPVFFYPMSWFLNLSYHFVKISIFLGIIMPSIFSILFFNIFYKFCKISLIASCIIVFVVAVYIQYIANYAFYK